MPQVFNPGPRLPRILLDQLGSPQVRRRHHDKPPSAQSRRHAEHSQHEPRRPNSKALLPAATRALERSKDEFSGLSKNAQSPPPDVKPRTVQLDGTEVPSLPARKKRKTQNVEDVEVRAPSKREREKLAQDDDEVARLQKKLGIKSKKLPKSFNEEGLAGLLGDLDDVDALLDGNSIKKNPDRGWLEDKRRRAIGPQVTAEEYNDGSEEDTTEDDASGSDSGSKVEELDDHDHEAASFMGEDKDDEPDYDDAPRTARQAQPRRKRENPYVAPVVEGLQTKYVPPSRHAVAATDTEAKARLRKQIQGLLNKLSESNLPSIVGEIEKLYAANARQHVHSTIVDLLLNLICDDATLSMNFLALHAAFTAALYRTVGADIGALSIERLVEKMSAFTNSSSDIDSKQPLNLVTLLAHLYNFSVVTSTVLFDYIRQFISPITESHTELLLRVIRACGQQLRRDDRTTIKDIALNLQKQVGSTETAMVSVRTKFMVEEINRLKDSRLRAAAGANDVSELVTRYRKVLGSLSSRTLKAHQPLSISLADLRDGEKKGKWWLVSASWSGQRNEAMDRQQTDAGEEEEGNGSEANTNDELDLNTLATQHRMNTSIRKAIFTTLLSSTDYLDAHAKLTRLNLTRSQEQQIPRVLLHCVGAEPRYNPYYGLIAKKLCEHHKLKMALQFALWDLFKRLEADEDEDEKREPLTMAATVNYAKLFAQLVVAGVLPITVIKRVELRQLTGRLQDFTELFMLSVLQEATKKTKDDVGKRQALEAVFTSAKGNEDVAVALRWYVKKVLVDTDLVGSPKDREGLRWQCKIIVEVLAMDD